MTKIIVVGGGLAGLSATIEAYRNGANVVLVEKQPGLFGNSCKASSGMNALSHYQVESNITDSFDAFYKDTVTSGHHLNDPALVQVLVSESKSALAFLESFGLNLSKITQCGGHSIPRTHRQPPSEKPSNVGWSIISTLKQYILNEQTTKSNPSFGSIEFKFNSELTDLIMKDGAVVGVEINKSSQLSADAVILATGGYSHDYDGFIAEYTPQFKNLPTTNGNFAVGQGIKIAHKHGAQLQDMQFVQIHPTGFAHGTDQIKFLAPEALRGSGGILINQKGERFVDELASRDIVSEAIFKHTVDNICYLIMNQQAVDLYDAATFAFYANKGFFTKCQNIQELSSFIGSNVIVDTLQQTFSAYGTNDAFKKTIFPVLFTDQTYFVAKITPVIHYSMGGLKINAVGEVLQRIDNLEPFEQPILGLYAAGETTSKVHGQNRLAGNSLLECVVFGRITGKRASTTNTFNNDFIKLRLRAKLHLSETIKLFRFDLPTTKSVTGCKTGQYIALRNGDITRYYSPVSRPDDFGKLDLIIKVDDKGIMSKYLNEIQLGEHVDIKGPMGELDLDFVGRNKLDSVILICGGTGISPMIQIIRTILHNKYSTTVHLIYGASEPNELVYKDFLIHKALNSNGQIKVTLLVDQPHFAWPVMSCEAVNVPVSYGVGFCTQMLLESVLGTSAGKKNKIVICGPWKMCVGMKELMKKMEIEDYYSYM